MGPATLIHSSTLWIQAVFFPFFVIWLVTTPTQVTWKKRLHFLFGITLMAVWAFLNITQFSP